MAGHPEARRPQEAEVQAFGVRQCGELEHEHRLRRRWRCRLGGPGPLAALLLGPGAWARLLGTTAAPAEQRQQLAASRHAANGYGRRSWRCRPPWRQIWRRWQRRLRRRHRRRRRWRRLRWRGAIARGGPTQEAARARQRQEALSTATACSAAAAFRRGGAARRRARAAGAGRRSTAGGCGRALLGVLYCSGSQRGLQHVPGRGVRCALRAPSRPALGTGRKALHSDCTAASWAQVLLPHLSW